MVLQLRSIRDARRLKRPTVCERYTALFGTRLHPYTLQRWEGGVNDPPTEALWRLAKIYAVSMNDLFLPTGKGSDDVTFY